MSQTPIASSAPTHNLKGFAASSSMTDTPPPLAIPARSQSGSTVFPAVLSRDGSIQRIGEYDVIDEIGRGGMSVVYKAYHRCLRRLVALKMLQADDRTNHELRERIQAEAEAVARIQNSGVIQVFETGTVQLDSNPNLPSPFIALEFVDGGDLARLCQKPQPPRIAAEIVAKLARAVGVAHDRGVIHRDLKPSNVLLTRDGEPKIADFGVAKQIRLGRDAAGRFLTQTGMVVGTPEYMAPEQARGDEATASVDIYALGVILYELLVAHVPLQAATPGDTMFLIQQQEPISPRQFQPDLPRDIETICMKCLEKEPAKRYATARDLADDLERYLDYRPIVARRITEWERFGRWCRRNPSVAASLGGFASTIFIALLLVSWSYRQAERARVEESFQRGIAEASGKQERWERYRANIVAAAGALDAHNAGNAGRMLQAAPEEYRDCWEWRYYSSRLDRSQRVLEFAGELNGLNLRMSGPNRALFTVGDKRLHSWDLKSNSERTLFELKAGESQIHVSSDSKRFAYVRINELVIADLESGTELTRIPGIVPGYASFQFCADSRRIVTGVVNGNCRLWDATTGRELAAIAPKLCVAAPVIIDPTGRWVIFSREGLSKIEVGDFETGRVVHTLDVHEQGIFGGFFNHRGTQFAVTERFPSNRIKIWNVSDGSLVREFAGHSNCISFLTFSHDDRRIATGSDDQMVCAWDIPSGRRLFEGKGHIGRIFSLAYSPDGETLASVAQDRTIQLRNAETGKLRDVLYGHSSNVTNLVFSSDSGQLVTTSSDQSVRLWDLRMIGADSLRGHKSFVYGVAFHPDGERIASAAWDGTARVWHATSGRELLTLDHGSGAIVTSVGFNPEGTILATRSRTAVALFDASTGRPLRSWDVPVNAWHDSRLAFDPSGRWIATGRDGNLVQVLDTQRDEHFTLAGHLNEVRDVAFSPDGRWLVSGGDDGDYTARVWDFAERKHVRTLGGHSQGVLALAFSADGTRLATGSLDGNVRIWDTATWSELAVLKHTSRVYGLAFTPDGGRLACACADNTARLWDTRTFQESAELRGHEDYVHQIAFSPDGTRCVTASGDKTVRIWDTLMPKDR